MPARSVAADAAHARKACRAAIVEVLWLIGCVAATTGSTAVTTLRAGPDPTAADVALIATSVAISVLTWAVAVAGVALAVAEWRRSR